MEKRLLTLTELCDYIGVKRTKAIEFGAASGAIVRIGRRRLYDKDTIDAAIDKLKGGERV